MGDFDEFDIDAVTVSRYATDIVGIKATSVPTTIWSGKADFQEGGGQTYYGPDGSVEEADAVCLIDSSPLPDVHVGDVVQKTSTSKSFVVAAVVDNTYAFPFRRIMLKRGPIPNKQPNK